MAKLAKLALIVLLVFFVQHEVNGAEVFSDNFDSYSNNSSIVGQGGWTAISGGSWNVQNTWSVSPSNSLYDPGSNSIGVTTPTFSSTTSGTVSFSFKVVPGYGSSNGTFFSFVVAGQTIFRLVYTDSNTKFKIEELTVSGASLYSGLELDTVYDLILEFDYPNEQWRLSIDGGDNFSSMQAGLSPSGEITSINMTRAGGGERGFVFDDIIVSDTLFSPPVGVFPTAPTGTGTSPTYFTGSYTNDGNYNRLVIFVCPADECTTANTFPIIKVIPAIEETGSYTLVLNLTDGDYRSFGVLLNNEDFSQSSASEWVDFTVDNTEVIGCSINELAGCFQQVMLLLFKPSDYSLSKFSLLYEQIRNKPPFGYGFAVVETLNNTDLMETEVYTLPTLDILDEMIFDYVRTGMSWLLWVLFLFGLFKTFRNIHL